METRTGFGPLVVLLLALLNSAHAEDKYFVVGGKLVLRPSVSVSLTSILWKHKGDLLAEWVQGDPTVTYYRSFKGRTTLEKTTGHLEINNMSMADQGRYSLEINNAVHPPDYDVKVIKKVPQPALLLGPLTCTRDSDSCTLTCGGDTAGAEPVTYSWKEGDGEWSKSGNKTMQLLKEETAHVKTFTCRIKNPVSQKESEPCSNPFFQEEGSVGVAVGVSVFMLLLLLIAAGLVIWKRKRILEYFFRNKNEQVPLNASGSTSGNGQPAVSVEVPANENEIERLPLKDSGSTPGNGQPSPEPPADSQTERLAPKESDGGAEA
ncbi:SLAM family member 9-like [Siniperca chuatsi]|uniref:SLAM family member 9-like n=1 Tax=Siniperca chuatsi TaxID=119488 RepID=UPI001CE0B621|nr:SLAM family member 9-like [Siniperca chuatsi]